MCEQCQGTHLPLIQYRLLRPNESRQLNTAETLAKNKIRFSSSVHQKSIFSFTFTYLVSGINDANSLLKSEDCCSYG